MKPRCQKEGKLTYVNILMAVSEKNPGHKQFMLIKDFNTHHLSERYRDNDLVEYMKITADFTVRIAVTKTNEERPEFWPNTQQQYPSYDMRGSEVLRLGTGMVWYEYNGYKLGACPCLKCQYSSTPSKVWDEVLLKTARHVVFDDLEARSTTCRLFYDSQESPLVTLDGWTVAEANTDNDWCQLKCVTCDVDLLDKLDKMRRDWTDLWVKVNNKYERFRDEDKLTWIVSHPHGCPKQISVGHWIDRDSATHNTTCTCPGSSGACVHPLGYDGWWSGRHVHSGVSFEGINFSAAGLDLG